MSETFESVLSRYMTRRALLKGSLAGLVISALEPARATAEAGFVPLAHSTADRLMVPAGYSHNVVIRWGDPILVGAPEFAPTAQTPAGQALQFGYNCDFVGYLPLDGSAARGLLVVNLEYTNPELMFAGYDGRIERKTREMVDIEMAAHGVAIVEVRREPGRAWTYVKNSPYNRRLTAETPMAISGPAAGHRWMQTGYDPSGTMVRGTLNNCAAGITPWGTVLTCEENVNLYFGGAVDTVADPAVKTQHRRFAVRDRYGWSRFHPRFDVGQEPNEPLRFGWVVEVDPHDPGSRPVKRTALGRAKHEAATVTQSRDGRAVVYSGDDEAFEYIYKFVTTGKVDLANRAANAGLLDHGTLYAAKFRDDGSGEWLPLVHGQNGLTAASGFDSQAEVLIDLRRAGDLVGATKMDRPEDVEASPTTGKVYAIMTNNTNRTADQKDRANPRANNRHGHVLELTEDGGDHAARTFRWQLLLACGDPKNPAHEAFYGGHADGVSWMSCPDNLAFDPAGQLWIATDGQPSSIGQNDAVYLVETTGARRGAAKMFMSGLPGGEICGPAFTPDGRTLFVAIQHPGEDRGSTYDNPLTRFPDYRMDTPPRPSVVAIYRNDGGVIGR